ncbi:hypothetical protein A7K73_01965 [Candidatus Methylacidiphilum fumarolicum]|nr:hypothetical protein A7K73_01965 [Candidatus Methylacidiphilum fumarolicum]TFE72685.1 hypothetical protein A7K72_07885 [Candidatus Methylacidiphilum fumarolicum]TFE77553.1 hypothetical protein A7D33_04035 [Candidatus Methylacidiphilum fumarolicum]
MRWVWNKALALQKQLEADYLLLSYYEHAWSLALWRHSEEYGCLYNAPTFPLQWTLKFLDQAIQAVFDKFPPSTVPAA